MTDEQKARIDKLRENNFSYKQVADAIGVSINTVKSYCRRQKEKAEEPESKEAAGEAENPKPENTKTEKHFKHRGLSLLRQASYFYSGKTEEDILR